MGFANTKPTGEMISNSVLDIRLAPRNGLIEIKEQDPPFAGRIEDSNAMTFVPLKGISSSTLVKGEEESQSFLKLQELNKEIVQHAY